MLDLSVIQKQILCVVWLFITGDDDVYADLKKAKELEAYLKSIFDFEQVHVQRWLQDADKKVGLELYVDATVMTKFVNSLTLYKPGE